MDPNLVQDRVTLRRMAREIALPARLEPGTGNKARAHGEICKSLFASFCSEKEDSFGIARRRFASMWQCAPHLHNHQSPGRSA
jgi:hypothetical protein